MDQMMAQREEMVTAVSELKDLLGLDEEVEAPKLLVEGEESDEE